MRDRGGKSDVGYHLIRNPDHRPVDEREPASETRNDTLSATARRSRARSPVRGCSCSNGPRPRSPMWSPVRSPRRCSSSRRSRSRRQQQGRGRRAVLILGNKGWSLYGAQRSQPVATGGKWDGRKNGSNRRKPLPRVATGCLRRSMVRAHPPLRKGGGHLPGSARSAKFCESEGADFDSDTRARQAMTRFPHHRSPHRHREGPPYAARRN